MTADQMVNYRNYYGDKSAAAGQKQIGILLHFNN